MHRYLKGEKTCRTCNETKDYRSYYKANGNVDGYENQCKPCKNNTRDPERRRAYVNAWRKKKKAEGHYGLCKECKTPLGRNEGRKSIHQTGYCQSCNSLERHKNWNGGRSVNQDGYTIIRYAPGKTMLEHRYVMEQELGRKLYGDENVHHINGDRTDNNIENLELWSSMQPTGQRVKDKVDWAKKILERYT